MHKFLSYQRYFSKIFLLILAFHIFSIPVYADNIAYPQVSNVNTSTAKPGDMIMLYGKNFGAEGQLYCYGEYDQSTQSFPDKKFMTYKTVIGAYMKPKSPTSGIPDYRLIVQSITPDTIVAQIPSTMANGEYLIGYNAEFPKGICAGYGDILVGFARYDPLTVTGGTNTIVPNATVVPTTKPTLQPTTKPSISPSVPPTNVATKSADTKPTTASTTIPLSAKITTFISQVLQFFGLSQH